MDTSVIALPGEIMLVKVGKENQNGFYALIKDILPDPKRKGWWIVKFYPFIPSPTFKLVETFWILDNQQIRGYEFTMDEVTYKLCKIEFQESERISEPIERKNNVIPFLKRVK
jgi:hypothetical protein